MCHANNEKQKRQMTDGRELSNQEKIRTFGERKTYEYLGILIENTIKHDGNEIKNEKLISHENEKTTGNQTI